MIRLRVAAADLNRLLASVPDAAVVYRDGCFVVERSFGPLRVTLRAHPDLRDGRLRLAVPFAEVRGTPFGPLVGGIAATAWRWLEARIEAALADTLVRAGLPWELVWLEQHEEPGRGRIGTINVSARVLNEWLRSRRWVHPLALRLAAVEVDSDGVTVALTLVDGRRDGVAGGDDRGK